MKAQINVKYSEWLANGERFPGGSQEIEVSDELAPLLASAVDAGVVELEDPSNVWLQRLEQLVESQETSEEKLVEAMGVWIEPQLLEDGTKTKGYWDGPWYEGHVATSQADSIGVAELAVDVEEAK